MVGPSLNCLKVPMPADSLPQHLPDYIQPGLRILFVGINPGLRSARTGHHFAGYSNRFWNLLYDSALVTEPLTYREDCRLLEWELGMTNIIGRCSAGIDVLKPAEYQIGLTELERKVRLYQPRLLAFLGVTIFRRLFPLQGNEGLGLTNARVAQVPVFLLPNPSGRNAHYSYERMLASFRELRLAANQFPRLDSLPR